MGWRLSWLLGFRDGSTQAQPDFSKALSPPPAVFLNILRLISPYAMLTMIPTVFLVLQAHTEPESRFELLLRYLKYSAFLERQCCWKVYHINSSAVPYV
jgi:hypothetical protein